MRCIGGLDAVDYFQSFEQYAADKEKFEFAMNRLKYEVAKGIGKKIKHMPAPKPGYHDVNTCGECGYTAQPHHSYCPNCGTRYLKNPCTEKTIEEHQVSIEEWLKNGS